MSNPIKITEDTVYPSQYRLEWADGVLSEDFYNKTRATDILNNYKLRRYEMKKTDPRVSFKGRFVTAGEALDAIK
jgi:hypothetical protein